MATRSLIASFNVLWIWPSLQASRVLWQHLREQPVKFVRMTGHRNQVEWRRQEAVGARQKEIRDVLRLRDVPLLPSQGFSGHRLVLLPPSRRQRASDAMGAAFAPFLA